MKPTVGRIVLFNSKPSGIIPAIITFVNEEQGTVRLTAFDNTDYSYDPDMEVCKCGAFMTGNVTQGSGLNQWDWMPFQKDQQARLNPSTDDKTQA